MLDPIKLLIKSNYYLFKTIRFVPGLFGFYKKKEGASLDDFWRKRIDLVVQSPDNESIHRVKNAGRVVHDVQIMHNGLKINVGSYYGDGNTVLLNKNKGVHEPQEEKVFDEILTLMPPKAIMLELGSFWGFYSMCFQQRVKNGTSYLIEPDPHSLLSGKNNFKLNNLTGLFFNYYISDRSEKDTISTITIDDFLKMTGIDHVHILHSDIQGYELKMLHGAQKILRRGAVDYLFVSTHSNELHDDCRKFLVETGYEVLCDANLDETYSWDGLIVAKSAKANGPSVLKIHKRKC